jgi:DNA-binding transcriptional MerR regulator/methylmalonyl-CoA mutase cobalamin-binding subunit
MFNVCIRYVQPKSYTNVIHRQTQRENRQALYKVGGGRNLTDVVFRIRHAAKMAGISPGLLRAWERRYRLVQPKRTESGYRVYSPDDVELLSAAARLVSAGHSISEVARLAPAAIRLEADRVMDVPAAPPAPASEPRRPTIDPAVAGALRAIRAFDRGHFEEALLPVLGALAPAAACEEVLMPLLRAIGDEWERGTLSIAAEHFGSALVRAKILHYLQFLAQPADRRRLVCACPEEERHEGGLLAFAVHAAAAGWHIVYLGASTPLGEALETAVRLEADAVALSLTGDSVDLGALAAQIEGFTRKHARPRILIGGRRAVAQREPLERAGATVVAEARPALEPLLGR